MRGYSAAQTQVLEEALLRKTRRLPFDGEVLSKLGDPVKAADVVASAQYPAPPVICMVGETLGVPTKDLTRLLRRWAGETVERDEVLAEKKGFLGMGHRECRSPISGVVISGPHAAGEVVIAPPDEQLTLRAGLPGRVVGIVPSRGVIIETMASYVQGVGGYGAEAEGVLRIAVGGPAGEIDSARLSDELEGSVLVGGFIGEECLAKAAATGVASIVVGGLTGEAYQWLLANRPALTVVITEGAGPLPMANVTFGLLQRRAGMRALVNGTASPDAQAEVIIGLPGPAKGAPVEELQLAVGTRARLMSGIYAGKSGRIAGLPPLPRRLASGIASLVAELTLDGGETITAARDNLVLTN